MDTYEIYDNQYIVQIANETHFKYADTICTEMESSAKVRGTGISKRSPEYLKEKMQERKAVIAFTHDKAWVGFCYIETWEHGKFVANSGLIVHSDHRKSGIATQIKKMAFNLSRERFPDAKIIGITTSLAVLKINSDLGYEPTTFSELPVDDAFWKGCQSCVNYDVLTRTNRKNCLCTGMMFDPEEAKKKEAETDKKTDKWELLKESKLYERWLNFKKKILISSED